MRLDDLPTPHYTGILDAIAYPALTPVISRSADKCSYITSESFASLISFPVSTECKMK